jgi:Flp pilus assembly protein TadD
MKAPRRWLLGLIAASSLGCGARADRDTPKAFDPDLAVELADTLIRAKAYDNALPMLQRALKRTPKDPRLHYLRGVILRDRGIYPQAHEAFSLSLSLAPKLAATHSALGILYDLQGKQTEGLKAHERAVELNPQSARFFNNLGFSHYLAGRWEKAEIAYRQGLKVDPGANRLFLNLGFALAAQGKDEEALRTFRQSLDTAGALNNLALAQQLRGDTDAARRMFKQALAENPSLPQALANLDALQPPEETQ